MRIRTFAILLLCPAITACSEGEFQGGLPSDSFAVREEANQARLDAAEADGIFAADDLPATGSANYQGTAILDVLNPGGPDDGTRLAGLVDLDVEFDGVISGTVTDFVDDSGQSRAGAIDIDGGCCRAGATGGVDDAAFYAGTSGSVTLDGGVYTVVPVDSITYADFYGPTYDIVSGDMNVSACNADPTPDCLGLFGPWTAER